MRRSAAAVLVFVTVALGLTIVAHPGGALSDSYRRWTSGKTATCSSDAGGARVNLSNQNVEFSSLLATDQFTINYILDGVNHPNGPFTVEQTSGTKAYGGFTQDFDAYPFTFGFRLDTIRNGSVIYRSQITLTCTGDGSVPANVVDTFVPTDPYRRWKGPKTATCSHTAGAAKVSFTEQDVEFNDLPAGAQFTIHYIDDGVDTVNGPFAVEQQNGTKAYASFSEVFPSYPFTFAFRIDTLIGGQVTYTSKLVVTCTGDGTSTVAPIHAAVTPPRSRRETAFVKRQYQDMTAKDPTASNLAAWIDKLSTGAATKGELIDGLRRTSDNVNAVDPAVRLYRAFLQRTPDAGGLRFWVARRRTGAWTLYRMADQFSSSNEFKTKYGTLTNRQFVERIYTDVLGRTPDTGGIDFWTGRLDARAKTRGQVMVGFSESSEYKRKQAESTDVSVISIFLLGRRPTELEVADWVSRQKAGTSRAELAKELLTSPAYAAHVGS
ncbi:MAG: DUF4214 domain-containing protein [Acidimicrobiales bacterium]